MGSATSSEPSDAAPVDLTDESAVATPVLSTTGTVPDPTTVSPQMPGMPPDCPISVPPMTGSSTSSPATTVAKATASVEERLPGRPDRTDFAEPAPKWRAKAIETKSRPKIPKPPPDCTAPKPRYSVNPAYKPAPKKPPGTETTPSSTRFQAEQISSKVPVKARPKESGKSRATAIPGKAPHL